MTAVFAHKVEPVAAAQELRTALAQHGIRADVQAGYGLALVAVGVGLVVWCHEDRFSWRIGWNPYEKRPVYARHPVLDPAQAAHRIARRYAELCRRYARSRQDPS